MCENHYYITFINFKEFSEMCGTIYETRAMLVFVTERKNNVDPCLRSQTNVNQYNVKVYNNTVMYHLSIKLSDKFHPNQMYTSDKIVVKPCL